MAFSQTVLLLDEFYKTWVAILDPKGNNCPCGTFCGKIDLKKKLSQWKRRYTTLSKFYAPGSWAPGSVNVDDFNFSPPYIVAANKHVDFHTRVVRLKEDFGIFCKVWLGHLHITFCLSNRSLNDWISKSLNVWSINWPIAVCSNNCSLETCNQVLKVYSVSKRRVVKGIFVSHELWKQTWFQLLPWTVLNWFRLLPWTLNVWL